MDEFLKTIVRPGESWNAAQIAANCGSAFLLGLFVSWIYRRTHCQLTWSYSFVNTLVLVSMIMGMVIMVIDNNIARAFGLAGAMSIIRFRTAVKDTRDTAFVFYSLGAGMAAGTGNLPLAWIGTLLIGLFIVILHLAGHGVSTRHAFILTFDTLAADADLDAEEYKAVFRKHFRRQSLMALRSARSGEVMRHRYGVILKEPARCADVVTELSSIEGIHRVSLSVGVEGEM